MGNRTTVVGGVVSVALVCVVMSACGGNGNVVGPGGQVRSITIAGAAGLDKPGATSQLTVTALFADGTSRDVTHDTQWATSDSSVVTVAQGLAVVVGYGKADITASYFASATAA